MWIIAKSGFVSLVQHNTDPSLIRARARRREHLIDTFALADDDVIDLGANAPDYRWHADIERDVAADALMDAVTNLNYESHVKESVSGTDNVMYRAMMDCWTALHRLQEPTLPARDLDWWTPPTRARGYNPQPSLPCIGCENTPTPYRTDDGYAICATCVVEWEAEHDDDAADPEAFQGQVRDLADKMLAGGADDDGAERPALKVYDYRGHHPDSCSICGEDIDRGDEYVVLPRGFLAAGDAGGPTHEHCIDESIELDYSEVDGL